MDKLNLYCGDCLDVMKRLVEEHIKVDAVIVDPPYSTTNCSWDVPIPVKEMWSLIDKLRLPHTPILIFGQEPFASFLRLSNRKNYKYDLYWKKERPTNIFQIKKRAGKVIETVSVFYEKQCTYNPQMVVHNGKRVTNKIKDGKLGLLIDRGNKVPCSYIDNGTRYPTQLLCFNRDCLVSNLHPTQKPIALLEYLIKTFTNEGDTVLDFAMGSGTTGVACMNTNRNFIGIELNEEYFRIAEERIRSGYYASIVKNNIED